MRNVSIPRVLILTASIALAIAGCTRSSGDPPSASTEPSSLTCKPGQRQCVGCNGGLFCAVRCPECAPQAAPELNAEPVAATPSCQPPNRVCLDCTGKQICARFCPECPAPAVPRSDPAPSTLALRPTSVESCGGAICRPGTSCCNPSCGICTPKGVNCTQQSCN